MREENNFIKGLKVSDDLKTNQDFPKDEDILKNMQSQDKMFCFEIEDIDRKIKTSKLTKLGEQLFLYRKKITIKNASGYACVYSEYYIVNAAGKVVGRIPISCNNPNELCMDYWIKSEFQGKGIGTIALGEVISEIFEEKEFDGFAFSSLKYPGSTETEITRINLEINEENEASKIIASKNGFKKSGDRSYNLTLEDYQKNKNANIRDE